MVRQAPDLDLKKQAEQELRPALLGGVRRLGTAAVALMLLVLGSAAAHADAAAGRRAYDKGDYLRAAAEWQAAADRGNADAEFGLGNLYEFGAGDLPQDYTRAAYWYRKAAEGGNTEAEYRLALITAAGGDNFPSDLAEADKWASLAAKSQGVWGSLAADFLDQLDRVASPAERAEGDKRAAAWSEAAAAKKAAPVTASLPPAPEAGAVAPRKGGCPGWPFPTLPCTVEFPPLASAGGTPSPAAAQLRAAAGASPAAAEPPLDRLNQALARIDCASLQGRASPEGIATVSGLVADAAERAKLVRLAAQFFPAGPPAIEVEIVPPPLCRSVAAFDAMRRAGLIAEDRLRLKLDDGSRRLREGDPIRLEVRAPAYPVDLRIDYFALDGRVLHLAPERGERPPQLAADAVRLFGDAANGENWRAGGAPFGTEFIAVVAAAAPLDLGFRPQVEPAADYLRDLKRALSRAHGRAGRPNLVQILTVRTSGRS